MAWALVQGAVSVSQSPVTATMTKAFTSNVTAGNRIFVWTVNAGQTSSTGAPAVPTDSLGNTYTLLLPSVISTNNPRFALYSAVVGTTGACTVSVGVGTVSGTGSEMGFTLEEYSGLDTSAGTGCLDRSSTGSGTATPISCGTTAATTGAGQLALAAVGDWGNTATYTAPSGFVLDTAASKQADATSGIAVANKTSASGATETGSFAFTFAAPGAAATSAAALIAVIKLASSVTTTRPGLPNRRFWRAAHRSANF